MSRQTTLGRFGFKKSISHRNSVMETKAPDFVSTTSRTIKCNHCSKLFVIQRGLSVHEKCVYGVSGMTKAAKICHFQLYSFGLVEMLLGTTNLLPGVR